MSDYSKMKNADLEALLKERGLPHSGKKADLVARLQEDDKKKASAAVPEEDEIDWDLDDTLPTDEPKTTTTTTAAAVTGTKKEEPKTQVAKAAKPAVATTMTVETAEADAAASTTDEPTAPPTADVPAKDYTAGLKETTAEDEIEKRRKRIKRFMDPNDPESVKRGEEELKKLDRAEKFKDLEATTKVDSALPERKRKRDYDNESGEGREGREGRGGGFKRRGRRFGRGGRGGDSQGVKGGTGAESKGSSGVVTWMSNAERAKAEARKQRFAQSTA